LAVVAVLSLAGCWAQWGGANAGRHNANPLESALTASNVATLSEIWSTPETVTAVWGDTAYMVIDGELVAVSVKTGNKEWTSPLPGTEPRGSFSVQVGPFVTGTDGDEIAVLYAHFYTDESGEPAVEHAGMRWDRATGKLVGVLSTPPAPGPDNIDAVSGTGIVAYETFDRRLEVVSATADTPPPDPGGLPTSKRLWGATNTRYGVASVIDGGRLVDVGIQTLQSYPVAGCGQPECLPTWTANLGSFVTAVTASDGHVFALTSDNRLTSFDAAGGTVEWRATLPGRGQSLAVANGLLYASGGPAVQAFPLAGCGQTDCTPKWTADLPAAAAANLVVAGGVLYAGAEDATVTAFPAAGCGHPGPCPPLATVAVTESPGAMVVAAGHLFVTYLRSSDLRVMTQVFGPTV
jgi:outer membrane protein assembly factor BamB